MSALRWLQASVLVGGSFAAAIAHAHLPASAANLPESAHELVRQAGEGLVLEPRAHAFTSEEWQTVRRGLGASLVGSPPVDQFYIVRTADGRLVGVLTTVEGMMPIAAMDRVERVELLALVGPAGTLDALAVRNWDTREVARSVDVSEFVGLDTHALRAYQLARPVESRAVESAAIARLAMRALVKAEVAFGSPKY